jgi:transcriptional regulator with XRE-family HTH domain
MGTASKRRKPNERLRYQRHLRGWTLREVADKLYDLCASEGEQESGMSADTVGRWELGVSKPSLFYQQKLCALFGQSAEELGLIEPLPPPQERLPAVALRGQPVAAVPVPSSSQPIDLLAEASGSSSEQALGAWLAAGAADLSALCAAGWSLEEVLTSLQVVLKGVQAMSHLSRRRLLQLGTAAVVSSVPMPEGRHISAEERANLHSALGESIGAGWKLFHTSSMPRVLAVGQAQLFLVQQASSNLYPSVRATCYSSIYNLIGAALHFQGHYDESYQTHERAYLAALEGGDVLNMPKAGHVKRTY